MPACAAVLGDARLRAHTGMLFMLAIRRMRVWHDGTAKAANAQSTWVASPSTAACTPKCKIVCDRVGKSAQKGRTELLLELVRRPAPLAAAPCHALLHAVRVLGAGRADVVRNRLILRGAITPKVRGATPRPQGGSDVLEYCDSRMQALLPLGQYEA